MVFEYYMFHIFYAFHLLDHICTREILTYNSCIQLYSRDTDYVTSMWKFKCEKVLYSCMYVLLCMDMQFLISLLLFSNFPVLHSAYHAVLGMMINLDRFPCHDHMQGLLFSYGFVMENLIWVLTALKEL